MEREFTEVYCGSGKGKTTLAIGQCLRASAKGKSVIIIQFLKGKDDDEISFIKRLEPEIKLFRFQKSDCLYDELSDESGYQDFPF